jgi:hypothetical protein
MEDAQKIPSYASIGSARNQSAPPEIAQQTPAPPPVIDTGDDFSGHPCGLQVNVPSDLRESLKLLSHKTGRSMAEIVFSCLTTQEIIHKSWVTTKKPEKRAA